MAKIVKDELGNIQEASSQEGEKVPRLKMAFYAVRVQFANGGLSDIAYYEAKKDAEDHGRTMSGESARALGVRKIWVAQLELIMRSN